MTGTKLFKLKYSLPREVFIKKNYYLCYNYIYIVECIFKMSKKSIFVFSFCAYIAIFFYYLLTYFSFFPR